MAKDDELEWDDDDLGMDDDLGDLEAEFGMSEPPPPKDKREAITRSLKDAGGGVLESFKNDDPIGTAAAVAKSAIPSSLSSEASQVADLHSSLKEKYDKSVAEVKSSARATTKALDSVIPEAGLARKALEKIKNKLGDEESGSTQESKEELQAANIATAMSEVFGEQNKAEQVKDLVNSAVAERRHKSQSEILANISANVEQTRKFNFEITNAYYRRSLELQYKSLFTAKEQLEVLKSGIDTFSGQFETIVNNTALPDILKVKRSEALKETLAEAGRKQISEMFYSENNPINVFKTNAIGKMTNAVSAITGGLGAIAAGAEQKAGMDEMGSMGPSKGAMIGGMLGDGIRSKIASTLGNRFAKTGKGEEGIFRVKNAMADLPSFFKDQAEESSGKDGMINNAKSKLFGFLGDMSSSKEDNDVKFNKRDLDEVAMFDNRAHSSLVKVIPGLLSKIYGEVKSIRTKDGKPEDNELTFDHNNNKFVTKAKAEDTIKSDLANRLNRGANNYFESILGMIEETSGYSVPKNSLADVRASFFMHLLNGGKLNSQTLVDPGFISDLPKDLRKPFKDAAQELLAKAQKDPGLLDSLNRDIKSTKFSLPNINKELMDMHESGSNDLAMSLGAMKQDERTKEFQVDKEGVKKLLAETSKTISVDDLEHEKRFRKKLAEEEEELRSTFDKKVEEFTGKAKAAKDKYGKKLGDATPDILKPQKIKETATSAYGTAKTYAKKGYEESKLYATDEKYRTKVNADISKLTEDKYKKSLKGAQSVKDSLSDLLKESEVSPETQRRIVDLETMLGMGLISPESYLESRAEIFFEENRLAKLGKLAGSKVKASAEKFATDKDLSGKFNTAKTSALSKVDSVKKQTTEFAKKKAEQTRAYLSENLTDEQKAKIKAAGMKLEDIKDLSSPYAQQALAYAGVAGDMAINEGMKGYQASKEFGKTSLEIGKQYATDKEFRGNVNDKVSSNLSSVKAKTLDVATHKIKTAKDFLNATLTDEQKHKIKAAGLRLEDVKDLSSSYAERVMAHAGVSHKDMLERSKQFNLSDVKGKLSSYKETVTGGVSGIKNAGMSKVNEFMDKRNELKTLTPEEEETFRTQFFNSDEFQTKAVTSFDEYLTSLGYRREDNLDIVKKHTDKVTKAAKEKFTEQFGDPKKAFEDKFNEIFNGKKPAPPEEELKQEFLNSEEFKNGTVKTFEEWKLALNKESEEDKKGKSAYNKINSFFKKTRSFERKLIGGAFKKVFGKKEKQYDEEGNEIKKKGLLKRGLGLAGGAAGVGAKTLGSMFGVYGNDGEGAFGKLNKGMKGARSTERSLIGSLFKKSKKEQETDDKLNNTLEKIDKKLAGDKKKPAFNDKDGDGDRDGGWKDRLKEVNAVDNPKLSMRDKMKNLGKGIMKNKGLAASGILLGLLAVGKAMGVTMDDVKGFAKGMWEGIKGVGKILGGVWDVLKWIWGGVKKGFGYIKDGFNYLKTVPQAISINMREALSHLPMLGKLKPKKEEYAELEAKRNGTYQEAPALDENGQPLPAGYEEEGSDAQSSGEMAAYGVVGAAGLYAGKKVYNGAKRVVNVTKKTVNLGKKVVNKVSGKPPKPEVKKVKPTKSAIEKAKPKTGKVMSFLKSLKGKILKKFGKKGAVKVLAKLTAKIASRAVPFVGIGLLAYDAFMIGKYMVSDGLDFKSAATKAILGFDLFADDDLPKDENGEPIKPDEDEVIASSTAENKTNSGSSFENSSTNSKAQQAANNIGYKPQPNIIKPVGENVDTTVNLTSNPRNKAEVKQLLDNVGSKTGVDPNTLKVFAAMESGLDPYAKAPTSSASGLFQFIKSTWNRVVGQHGDKYGIPKGTSPFVAEANATMGAEFLKDNAKAISSVKPNIQTVDLYLAHFLGAAGAKKFLKANPNEIASKLFPAAANANKSIFFTPQGQPRTIGEVYQLFNNKVIKKARNYGVNLDGEAGASLPTNGNDNVNFSSTASYSGGKVGAAAVNEQDWYAKQQARKGGNVSKTPNEPKQGFKTEQQTKETFSSAKAKQSQTIQKTQVNNASIENSKTSVAKLSDIDSTLRESLKVQVHMANTLDKILANTTSNEKLKEEALKNAEKNKPVNNTTPVKTNMPEQAVSIKRRSYV